MLILKTLLPILEYLLLTLVVLLLLHGEGVYCFILESLFFILESVLLILESIAYSSRSIAFTWRGCLLLIL